MTAAQKIEYLWSVKKRIRELEAKMLIEQSIIEEEKASCHHITVDLGYYGHYPNPGDYYRCLICGKGKIPEFYYGTGSVVHAENYLPQYDITDPAQCDEKFELLQTIARGLLIENPNLPDEAFVAKMNGIIQESIAHKDTQDAPKVFAKTEK